MFWKERGFLFMQKRKGARNYAGKFYSGKHWEKLSASYRRDHPLCERCLKKGILEPAVLVHHKTHINSTNCTDPEILYGLDNLESLCAKCHAEEHSGKVQEEYDSEGRLIL